MTKLAAIDLGSNSFHLLEAVSHEGQLHFGRRLKEKVQIGAGLDADQNLSQMAILRSLACIQSFTAYLHEQDIREVVAAGTNTLRVANNREDFTRVAENLLGHPIQIIDGEEEARLIFIGAQHEFQRITRGLVIDIGGGSTEFAIGQNDQLDYTGSLSMGCVSYYQRFFADGRIYAENVRAAQRAASFEMEALLTSLPVEGLEWMVGTSGTLQSIAEICHRQFGEQKQRLTKDAIESLNEFVMQHQNIQELSFDLLDDNRRAILPAGLAIISAIYEALNIDELEIGQSALCEGLLVELNQSLTTQ